jgi:tetratricopeptide (TPR) repeat protein
VIDQENQVDTPAPDPTIAPSEVRELLQSLVEKSLVVQENGRYRLPYSYRDYGGNLLNENETERLRSLHRSVFVEVAEKAATELNGPEAADSLDRLEVEHENLRAALMWAIEDPSGGEPGLRLSAALQQYWVIRGYFSEGRARSLAALTHPQSLTPEPSIRKARAAALNGAGNLAFPLGDYALARTLHQEALQIRREMGDRRGIASSLSNLGNVTYSLGDLDGARALYEEALSVNRDDESPAWVAKNLFNIGLVATQQGDYKSAGPLFEEARDLWKDSGNKVGWLHSLLGLAQVAFAQDNLTEAEILYGEALILCREMQDRLNTAYALEGMAQAVLKRAIANCSEPRLAEQVAELYGAADILREAVGIGIDPANKEAYDTDIECLEKALGKEAFKAAFAKGRSLTWEQAIESALDVQN